MTSYFASLSDLVSPETLDQVAQAELDAIHRGAGRLDESVLLHGVRVLVQLAKEEARAEAQATLDKKHEQLREHYRELEVRTKEGTEKFRRYLVAQQERAVQSHNDVSEMVLHYRHKGTKRVPITELARAVGIALEDWSEQVEPHPFNVAVRDQPGGGS